MNLFGETRSSNCTVCGRPLKTQASIERGMGPVCAGTSAKPKKKPRAVTEDDFVDIADRSVAFTDRIIFYRGQGGIVKTNVPHAVVSHSPTGFNFGYGGAGPADLALNILETALQAMDYKGDRSQAWKGDCYRKAYALHQEFKWEFCAKEGERHEIEFETVKQWLSERI